MTRYEDEKETTARRSSGRWLSCLRARRPMSGTAFRTLAEMDHVEAKILDGVATLFPGALPRSGRFPPPLTPVMADDSRHEPLTVRSSSIWPTWTTSGRWSRPVVKFCYPEVSLWSASRPGSTTVSEHRAGQQAGRARARAVVRNSLQLGDPRAGHRRHRPEPGRQDQRSPGCSASCTTWPASACRCPGDRLACSSRTASSPTSKRRRTLDNLRSNLEDELVRMHDISGRGHQPERHSS